MIDQEETKDRTPLSARDLASIFREIRLGATITEAVGGCRKTRRKFEYVRKNNAGIEAIFEESRAARDELKANRRATA